MAGFNSLRPNSEKISPSSSKQSHEGLEARCFLVHRAQSINNESSWLEGGHEDCMGRIKLDARRHFDPECLNAGKKAPFDVSLKVFGRVPQLGEDKAALVEGRDVHL